MPIIASEMVINLAGCKSLNYETSITIIVGLMLLRASWRHEAAA
jgi:hypothetical protein